MDLTREEEAILNGEEGEGKQKAMELVTALGKIYGADDLIDITSAHLSGASYKTIDDGGLKYLEDMAAGGAKVSVPSTLNPVGMDRERWAEMHITPEFAEKQLRIIDLYGQMGIRTTCSCTPYTGANVPSLGDHVAWAESSALSFVNSYIGARTNREGGPGALAAAILGKTANYGLHLDEKRRPTVVIDADIVYNPYDSLYHMYYKREGASGTARGIYEATSDKLVGGTWKEVMHVTNEWAEQVEGSSTVRRINEDVYNLYYMRYSGGSAYKYCETDHLGLNVSRSANVEGTGAFQHGSVMTVTEEEYLMLQAWSDLRLYMERVQDLKAETGMDRFDEALRQAEEALALTSVPELATALPAAYEALKAAMYAYKESLCNGAGEGESVDFTFLLVNPSFTDGSKGWKGTAFTNAASGIAEFYDKTFDTYQVLEDMPAGTYRLQAQGFYRYGGKDEAHQSHLDGSEQLLAGLYLNEGWKPFMSLFDESADYTFQPYTYPDNIGGASAAFNSDKEYEGNEVTYELKERGDLRVGISKDEYRQYDWNAFDNFKFFYVAKPTAIREVEASDSGRVDVYTVSGVKVRSAVTPHEAVDGLPRGIYIVGRKKVVVD